MRGEIRNTRSVCAEGCRGRVCPEARGVGRGTARRGGMRRRENLRREGIQSFEVSAGEVSTCVAPSSSSRL